MVLMDAVELLEHDHRMVEQLFRDYHAAASHEQRRGVVEILVRELSKHAALEELKVFPLAKKVLPGREEAIDEHLHEHLRIKETLIALDQLPAGDRRADWLMTRLRREVEDHLRAEEGGTMPALREALDQQRLDELGAELDAAKKNAPTRPHPRAPDQPPGLALARPLATAYDRMRDRLQRRPRT